MIEMIQYELRKIFGWKGLYAGIAVVFLLYALYIYSNAPSTFNNYHTAYEYYQMNQGKVTDEKITMAQTGMKELNLLRLKGIRFDNKNLANSLLYRDIITIATQSKNYNQLLLNYENKKDITKTEALKYSVLKKVKPADSAFYTEGWKAIINFLPDVGYYIIIILTMFGISNIFPQEQTAGMNDLINSTKEGKRKLVFAKISASMIYIALLTCLFALINVMINLYFYGLNGFNVPFKNIYIDTPYNFKIWQFFLLQQLTLMGIASVWGLFTMFISILFRNSVAALSCGAMMVYLSNGFSKALGTSSEIGTMRYLIANFINLKSLCKSYKNIFDFLGNPILYEKVLSIAILGCILLLGISNYVIYQKRNKVN